MLLFTVYVAFTVFPVKLNNCECMLNGVTVICDVFAVMLFEPSDTLTSTLQEDVVCVGTHLNELEAEATKSGHEVFGSADQV
jgi:hypothetical protein